MRLDDRPANRQAHTHPIGLCREERLKRSLAVGESHPCVSYFNHDAVRAVLPRYDPQHFRTIANGLHRFDGIDAEIEQQVLDLHTIRDHRGQVGDQVAGDGYSPF